MPAPLATGIAYALLRLAATFAVGALIGWVAGSVVWGAITALALVLGWHLWQLWQLDWWLRNRSTADPPQSVGLWSDIGAAVVRLHRRKRFYRERNLRLLRDLQRSSAALPDGVVMVNAAREIQWFNATAGRLLGLQRGADLGLRIDNFLRQPEVRRYLSQPPPQTAAPPLEFRDSAVSSVWLSVQIVPYGDGQQLLLVRDVSEAHRVEALRRDFVANASHELRSPLTVIAGYLETLDGDSQLSNELRKPISEMRRQSERMRTLLDDLLELSRLDSSDGPVIGTRVDVPSMLRTLLDDALKLPQRPATIELQLDSSAAVRGDAALLHSAFWNLIENAVKYTPANGRVLLRWWNDTMGAHFSVADTGPGIAPEHLPRLTERFYRVDAGRSRDTGGTGLGLAIVKHVLQRHDGQLEVASEEGVGSVFTCHLPVTRLWNLT